MPKRPETAHDLNRTDKGDVSGETSPCRALQGHEKDCVRLDLPDSKAALRLSSSCSRSMILTSQPTLQHPCLRVEYAFFPGQICWNYLTVQVFPFSSIITMASASVKESSQSLYPEGIIYQSKPKGASNTKHRTHERGWLKNPTEKRELAGVNGKTDPDSLRPAGTCGKCGRQTYRDHKCAENGEKAGWLFLSIFLCVFQTPDDNHRNG